MSKLYQLANNIATGYSKPRGRIVAIILRHEDIVGLLSTDEVIAAVRAGLVEQAAGQVQVPPRITIDSTSGNGWLRVMPTILNGSGVMGYKAMHATPKVGVRYLVALYDLPSGELLAHMDADWLTAQRTAATAAVAADVLANPAIRQVGLIGSGEQAQALLTAMSCIRTLPRVLVFSPTPGNRARFAAAMSERLTLDVRAVDSPQAALQESDLVLSAFRSGTSPVVQAGWIRPGAHVTAISAVRPEARELEADVWGKADLVAVDDRAHAFESGDGTAALNAGNLRPEDAAELWELLGGQRSGRRRAEDITLFKSVGTASQDLAIAAAIYRRAQERGLGQDLGEFPHIRPV